MDMQGALRARLIAAGAVAAIAGQRVYWVDRPQSSALPALVLQTISGNRLQHMKGFNDLRDTRVQIAALATSYAQAKALIEAAIDALVPAHAANGIIFNRAMVEGEPDDGGERVETQFIHRHRVDLIMWWQAS